MVIRPGDVPGLSMARLGRLVLQEKKAKFGDEQFDDAGCKEAYVEVMQLALKLYTYSGPSGDPGDGTFTDVAAIQTKAEVWQSTMV